MNKIFSFVIIFIFVNELYSQNGRFNGWVVSPSVGFVQYQKENIFKTTAYSTSAIVGKEFSLQKNLTFITGAKVESLYGNHNDFSFKNIFIGIPVQIRYYGSPGNTSSIYVGLGIDNKFKINEKFENELSGTNFKGENGYHLGGLVELGYKTKASENTDFLIGINYTGDILQAGYGNVKNRLLNGINLSIGFELFKN